MNCQCLVFFSFHFIILMSSGRELVRFPPTPPQLVAPVVGAVAGAAYNNPAFVYDAAGQLVQLGSRFPGGVYNMVRDYRSNPLNSQPPGRFMVRNRGQHSSSGK